MEFLTAHAGILITLRDSKILGVCVAGGGRVGVGGGAVWRSEDNVHVLALFTIRVFRDRTLGISFGSKAPHLLSYSISAGMFFPVFG